MTVQILQPELEQLIKQQVESGAFESVEEVLAHALRLAYRLDSDEELTGKDLIAAMQACPVKEIDFNFVGSLMPVRDIDI